MTQAPLMSLFAVTDYYKHEAERLAQKHWHTLVADEAQAIKNALTKRSKAAMALQADFKLITTGTPIENHLGELWNLFNFINPGLLGSLQKFNERYAQAIENQQDQQIQQRLKKLLRPFILRRLKNDVLTELPSRTEVTLHVELSPEERALYEALRRNAMQTMMETTDQPGHKQLKILAEIMKLRRACCHPRLVMEESTLGSSKLQPWRPVHRRRCKLYRDGAEEGAGPRGDPAGDHAPGDHHGGGQSEEDRRAQ